MVLRPDSEDTDKNLPSSKLPSPGEKGFDFNASLNQDSGKPGRGSNKWHESLIKWLTIVSVLLDFGNRNLHLTGIKNIGCIVCHPVGLYATWPSVKRVQYLASCCIEKMMDMPEIGHLVLGVQRVKLISKKICFEYKKCQDQSLASPSKGSQVQNKTFLWKATGLDGPMPATGKSCFAYLYRIIET